MVRITQLPAETTPTSDDLLAMVDNAGAITKKVTIEDLASGFETGAIDGGAIRTDALADGAVPIVAGIISKSTLSTTGIKTITNSGLNGKKPQLVRFTALNTNSTAAVNPGTGSMSATTQHFSASWVSASAVGRMSGTDAAIGYMISESALGFKASFVSMDNGGFTINVITASGAFDIAYEAYA